MTKEEESDSFYNYHSEELLWMMKK
jgi:hypothetical protein